LIERAATHPLQFNPLFSLSKVLFHLGAYPECQTTAFESIRRFGPNNGPYFQIAASYEKQGDLRSALRYYKKARNISRREDNLKGARRVKAEMKKSRWAFLGSVRSQLRRVGLIQ
jgi:tetratricopeptide (TPR) repeat protein